jgi:hypothetical protein
MSLWADGRVLEAPLANTSGCTAEAVDLTSGATLWCGTAAAYGNVQLSPDGTLVAAANVQSDEFVPPNTDLYKNGAIAGAIPALGVG